MANAFDKGLQLAGRRLQVQPPKLRNPALRPIPPKQGIQPVVPPVSAATVPTIPQPSITQLIQSQPTQPAQSSPLQEVLRRKRMLEI